MGTSTSAAQFSRKLVAMGTVTQRNQKMLVSNAALAVKELIYAEALLDGVKPTSTIAGGRWGVRYDLKGFNNPTALVRVWGPFHLVERDTKPHRIGPRKRGRRRSGKRAVSFGTDLARAYVNHPGTTGKGSFRKAKLKAQVVVPRILSNGLTMGWRQVLR